MTSSSNHQRSSLPTWLYWFSLFVILGVATYFRFIGINWGEEQYLHPDERFLVWVGSDIAPVKSLTEYFNTATSSLNPHNRGHGFFVYGTLPMFLARYLVESIYGHSGFREMLTVGRPLSAIFDLLTLCLVAATAKQLFGRGVSLLAAAFYGLAVLPIQLSHFFKEDTFLNFFIFLGVYFAVRIVVLPHPKLFSQGEPGENRTPNPSSNRVVESIILSDASPESKKDDAPSPNALPEGKGASALWLTPSAKGERAEDLIPESAPKGGEQKAFTLIGGKWLEWLRSAQFWTSVAFGVSFGCAMASKLTAYPLAFLLPLAFGLRYWKAQREGWREQTQADFWNQTLFCLAAAGAVSILTFRIFQPYAFAGPGFFGLKPNEAWVANIREQRNQSAGDVDFPPALQWARRPRWFSWQNLTVWGLGLPLGILAWVGFLWMGWRLIKGELGAAGVLWGWTAFYFTWQSLQPNPTMRYQLPSYPGLTILAAWAIFALWQTRPQAQTERLSVWRNEKLRRTAALSLALLVLGLTFLWAFAFTRIYTRPVTRVAASRWIYQNVPPPIQLSIRQEDGTLYRQPVPFPYDNLITAGTPYRTILTPAVSGKIEQITLAHVRDVTDLPQEKTLTLNLAKTTQPETNWSATIQDDFLPVSDRRGDGVTIDFSPPIGVEKGQQIQLTLSLQGDSSAALTIAGAAPANESSWDDGLPLRLDGYDGYGGIYQRDLVFEMYWDDNPEKLARFLSILDQADYIFISSNRQWGTVPRVPERYPLSTAYYRLLIGCPQEKDVIWCYNVAQPGKFQGQLGFELVQVFESFPNLGNWRINDQFAEEAFTVYDHPKVLIFRKRADYDSLSVRRLLTAVDLSKVIHLTPRQASKFPGLLLLPPDRLREQQNGGTWSELFNRNALHNRNHLVSVLVWYLTLSLLGWVVYPLTRQVFAGLDDRGYPLSRTFGLLLLSYFVWLLGSVRVPFHRLTISVVFGALFLISLAFALLDWQGLRQEFRQRKKQFLWVEIVFLTFFLVDLFIRLGNPDLWHPWKGGEKPMDFAYFNAILKSTSFPPYDPWYAGGYLNYYYYGFVLMGVVVKWLGIVPAIAYNLILPTTFSLIALGAFSLGWNLVARWRKNAASSGDANFSLSWIAGLSSALGMAVLGNLGTLRMILNGYQKLVAPGGSLEGANLLMRAVWTLQGFVEVLKGMNLPYSLGDWYWIPSRAIPAPNDVEPITEFPFFTVLYADPHAHLFALPLSLLTLAFALSILLLPEVKLNLRNVTRLGMGGLLVGVLRPTNYSDYYPYLVLVSAIVAYRVLRPALMGETKNDESTSSTARAWLRVVGEVVLFVGTLVIASNLLFYPFTRWLGWGYSKINLWGGTHTPSLSYLVHWGLFLFVIVSWLVWESIDWMAKTPLSALRKLKPALPWIGYGFLLLLVVIIGLMAWLKVAIAWMVLPLAVWAGLLILRRDQPDEKRFVLFLVGTGLMVTLMVEIVVVAGDIGRMNTVFKFYLQVWTMFSVAAGAALAWLMPKLLNWREKWGTLWKSAFLCLVLSAALYPITATTAKIKDRMSENAPHTLDGMAFMAYSKYTDSWGEMDLSQDYRAILWMQDHIQGSPVIVEANLRDLYRWGSRFSIYTGLPGVVGWEWHQQQQRTLLPANWVTQRIEEIEEFYRTLDIQAAVNFLQKYQVRYIIVGQQERGKYPGPGLDKFEAANGLLWQEVYRDGQTVIYEVNQP
jgi:YYY domain-containing protein